MKKLSIFIAFLTLFMSVQAQQKNAILKGQVTDARGKALASVVITNSKDTTERAFTDTNGLFTLFSANPITDIDVSKPGYGKRRFRVSSQTFMNIVLDFRKHETLSDAKGHEVEISEDAAQLAAPVKRRLHFKAMSHTNGTVSHDNFWTQQHNTEQYSAINENIFHRVTDQPLSTFSADVDRAAYANVRRFINHGQLPPIDAVRVEEMINYFDYDYEAPKGDVPVAVFTEVATAPWNSDHYLMHIGIKAKELDKAKLPPSNLVFLIDVSGSMGSPNKLPLLKSAMKMLVGELRDDDKVAIAVYAGAAGLVLESTPGHEKGKINEAIDKLESGGSTAGGAGIKLAYKVAADQLIEGGNNRVILATDGDFNVGASSDGEMQRLIEEKREEGVFLTVLGFGMGNYKDAKMEILADKGNGNYAYIDNLTEAKKTLVSEFGGTLFTIAKDVKLQVEFNPAVVAEYRLIGYENRKLNNEDFNDDKKDAGEMGVGHIVTALYEIVPVGKGGGANIDPLKYHGEVKERQIPAPMKFSNEMATVKIRYKEPDGERSQLISEIVKNDAKNLNMASNNLRWSSSVAGFGMLLRKSEHKGSAAYANVIELAESALGKDEEGYRRECLQLMRSAEILDKNTASR
ncbi:MAG: von Willebrand factor type A domain-containing protein [Cryomorphaceae bacterium]